jgi:hypothetical protein
VIILPRQARDNHRENSQKSTVFLRQYYVAGPNSPVTAASFTDPAFLDIYKTQAAGQLAAHSAYNKRRFDAGSDPVALWMGETGGAGGATAGATEVNGHFRDVFWYADKLGLAAQLGKKTPSTFPSHFLS